MTATKLHYGKKRATSDDRDLLARRYIRRGVTALLNYGHQALVKVWGMLLNDSAGDCVEAEACHATMLLTIEGGRYEPAPFGDPQASALYAAITGYNPHAGPPGENPTDQGTDVRAALAYRRKHGIVDANGIVHKIGAYVKVDHTDLAEVRTALAIFTVLTLGIECPASAQEQFARGATWTVVKGSQIEGGHCIGLVGFTTDAAGKRTYQCVTWGAVVNIAEEFLAKYLDEAWAYISAEDIEPGTAKTIDGFDLAQLQADLKALQTEA